MSREVDGPRGQSVVPAMLAPFAYQGLGILCLRHWRGAAPWTDLDVFSGTFFALTALFLLYETPLRLAIFRSPEALREASGSSYDPSTVFWSGVLSIGDLLIFLDYGHWHTIPALRLSALQSIGITIYAGAIGALIWIDTRLARYFQAEPTERSLITRGPFALVRHPRYASLALAGLGTNLIFASIFGWISLSSLIFLYRRRIRLEEGHLFEEFGSDYTSYQDRTPCFFPRPRATRMR